MSTALPDALAGFLTGGALIVAIGAQNVFVLRQGIARAHVFTVVAICTLSDMLLIAAGAAGMGGLVERFPAFVTVARLVGAAFLAVYGVMAARRALGSERLDVGTGQVVSRRTAALTCLAFTWLNPHVYLDTIVFLGSVGATHRHHWAFGGGAMVASVVWFTGIGYGARLLAPLFARPAAWRVFDALIALVMLTLAATLLRQA